MLLSWSTEKPCVCRTGWIASYNLTRRPELLNKLSSLNQSTHEALRLGQAMPYHAIWLGMAEQ